MKKLFGVLLAFALILSVCSCGEKTDAPLKTERFFDYQNNIRSVTATVTEGTDAYDVKIYFKQVNGKNVCRRIEYKSPETIEGLIFSLEGGKITAELEGVVISNSFFSKEGVFRCSKLLALSEKDIYSIEQGDGETTRALGKGEDYAWQVVTDSHGMPLEISYEDCDGSYKLSVKETELHAS